MKKNILFVLPTLSTGGAEAFIFQLAGRLSYRLNVILLVLTRHRSDQIVQKQANVQIIILDTPFRTLSFGAANFKDLISVSQSLKKVIRQYNIEVVLANLPVAHFLLRFTKMYSPALKFKLINIHHSLQYKANPLRSYKLVVFNMLNNVFSLLADQMNVFVSNASRIDTCRHFLIRKSRQAVIYNGVEYSKKGDTVNPFKDKNKINILFAGRLVPEKGLIGFLNSFIDMVRIFKNLQLNIVGDGPEKNKIEAFINNKGLTDHVLLYGSKPRNEIYAFYEHSQLIVIPSVSEGFGLVAVEAILAGGTVLASKAGGLSEIIIDGLNGFNYSSEKEMISKFFKILCGELKINHNQAVGYTHELFSMDNAVEKYQRIISQV